jgi:hypothetical protein
VRKFFYGPSNWLVTKFSAEDRRMFAFWTILFALVGSAFFGSKVWWVTVLSLIALVPNYSAETPVEEEA